MVSCFFKNSKHSLVATQLRRKCVFHTENMLPVISRGAYFQYEIHMLNGKNIIVVLTN